MNIECRQCGVCCRGGLIVEASALDVMREPKIAERCEVMDGHGELEPEDWAWSMVVGGVCPFLGLDNRCIIYETRPNDCVSFLAGEARCAYPVYGEGEDEKERQVDVVIRELVRSTEDDS